jgi:uridine monophosphate synthetase
MVVGLYDMGEIGFVEPDPEIAVEDPEYPEEAFRRLKSGRMSPHYVDTRNVTSFSSALPIPISEQLVTRDLVVDNVCALVDERSYDHLSSIPQAMTCLSGLVAQKRGDSVLWLRVGEKDHGIGQAIQGHYQEGDSSEALDNVITDSASKKQMAEMLEANGISVTGFSVIVDREEGGREAIEAAGYLFSAVVGMSTIVEILAENRRITTQQYDWSKEYQRRMTA